MQHLEVTARVLNFRTGPGTSHRIIRGLDRGTVLEHLSNRGDWQNVKDMNGVTGWVHGNYVKVKDISEVVNPIKYLIGKGWYVTSPFGPRTGKYAGFHRGTDMGGKPCGAGIAFPFKWGKVVAARTSGMGSWGNTTCIELSPDFVMLAAHQSLPMQVRYGQILKQGDILGLNGGTHHRYRGNHYKCHPHIEILNNNGSAPWRGSIWGDPEKFYL